MLWLSPFLIPIVISLGAFLLVATLVGMDTLSKHRARELRHQTIRLAMEKGATIPPELLQEAATPTRRPDSDLGKGVKLVFSGIGISVFLFLIHVEAWPVGLIVVFVGLGYLAAHVLGASSAAPPPNVR